ncbi:hypothetical protein DYB32_009407 [Aphanomyces invadans]|uniref:Uncharacterized protein n=1 Tax=Aphanomyces invadans TaxID=157072 RepID=A0A3R6V467_9STRA|nr:hypothetical protein DYB32_009407 [Aphanomyces invadans]
MVAPKLSQAISATPVSSLTFDVEAMSLEEISQFLERYATQYSLEEDPSKALSMVQQHPGFLSALIDTKVPSNLEILGERAFGHAVQRFFQRSTNSKWVREAEEIRDHELAEGSPSKPLWTYMTALQHLIPEEGDSKEVWHEAIFNEVVQAQHRHLVWSFSIFDLFLQLACPEIYFNPIKVASLLMESQAPVSQLLPRPFLLWSDFTLVKLAQHSGFSSALLTNNTPYNVKSAIQLLQEATMPFDGPHLDCYHA